MTHAYSKVYLEDAMCNMGDMLDYVANDCRMDKDQFFALFIACGLADAFGRGEPRVVTGMSGAELAREVFQQTNYQIELPQPAIRLDRTSDYWCGWILAYYQWSSGQRFERILQKISIAEIEQLYSVLHEAPEQKFLDVVQQRFSQTKTLTNLQRLRKIAGLTQAELSKRAGVSLRSIQLYEQRQKDINKAQARTLSWLAQALGCQMEDLLES